VDGVYQLSFPLGEGAAPDSYLDAVAEREGLADAASLRHVLAPESVVVIGASRRRGNAGRAIADNIRAGGYRGRLYTVNPHAGQVGGEHCLGSVLDLPEPADLAVIAVPAPAVLDAVDQCGRRGVRSVVVIASGLDAAGCADLLAACRRHGMRLLGPDSFGVAVPGLGLDATFAASHPAPGAVGLVMQSGGLGFAAVQHLSRLGIGISSFASVGRKLDVSGNDMLLWWEHDGVTKLAVLYLDSFGNPRKFARTARRAAARMPVLTVQAGRSAATQALFEQAGVITTSGFGELIEATALLATQPVPSGTTVALVTNVGSAGELAADACRALGLTVHHPHGQTINELRALVPQTGSVTGPVDMTATVSGDRFRRCLGLLAAAPDVHAIIAIVLPTAATGDLVSAIGQADLPVPCAAVVLSQPESVRLLPGGRIPGYGYPEAAVAAVARAAGYGAWRAEPRGRIPDFADIKPAQARALAREFLGHQPEGGWLPAPAAAALLGCYGIPGEAGVSVRVSTDRTFGPLLTASGKNAGQAVRLIPLTDTDADKLVRDVGGQAPLRELLLRVSRLADDLPEVTDLNLSVGRVRVAPYQPKDPFLRRLR
jgi:acyl-CoA synthetase (NDP forming)